jgi:hypothetical protein
MPSGTLPGGGEVRGLGVVVQPQDAGQRDGRDQRVREIFGSAGVPGHLPSLDPAAEQPGQLADRDNDAAGQGGIVNQAVLAHQADELARLGGGPLVHDAADQRPDEARRIG